MLDDEIIEIFRDIAVEESQYAPAFTVECLLQVDVLMKGGQTITIYCGEICKNILINKLKSKMECNYFNLYNQ